MKENNFLHKIWADPVWSKVISAIIIGILTYILKPEDVSLVDYYFKKIIIAILLFIFVMVIIAILQATKDKLNIIWLKKMFAKNKEDYVFLLWFPINKKKYNNKSYLVSHDDDITNIVSSIIIQKLRDHNILRLGDLGFFEIDTKAYDFLDKLLQQKDKYSNIIGIASKVSLEDLILKKYLK
jgi:hypothetical protein